jgi:hypothetical protein
MERGAACDLPLKFSLVAHLRASRVFTLRDEFESNVRSAMRTLRSHRLFIEQLVLVLREPHELEALGASTDLR